MEKFPHKGTRLSWQREKYQITSLNTTVFFLFYFPPMTPSPITLPSNLMPPIQDYGADEILSLLLQLQLSAGAVGILPVAGGDAPFRNCHWMKQQVITDGKSPHFKKPPPIIRHRFDGISLQVNSTSAKSCLAIRKWPHPPFHLR